MSIRMNGKTLASTGGTGLRKYSSLFTYSEGEVVIYEDNDLIYFYKSLQDSNVGNAITNTSYWKKVALGGGLS